MATTITSAATAPPIAAAARVEHASKSFGKGATEVRALDDVTVAFDAGRFTAIMGPSGSGKSTLLHCIAGLDTLSQGKAFIADIELGSLRDRQLTMLRRERIGFVFQSFNLLPTLTAKENIELPIRLAGQKPDRDWIDHVIDTVGLRSRLQHRPSELSGGQQQRVAVARALASRPQIVFADEPTGNLDTRSGSELLGFLRHAVDEMSQSIVMVTHDPSAAGQTDRIVFLVDGRTVDAMVAPTTDRVLDRMKSLGG